MLFNSCGKSKEGQTPITPTTPNETIESTSLCNDDSICTLPYKVFSAFVPSGFYDTGDQSTTLTVDSCGESPKYGGVGLRIVYKKGANWRWRAHL